jgi:hypothetical protein
VETTPVRNLAFFHGRVSTRRVSFRAVMRDRIDTPDGRAVLAKVTLEVSRVPTCVGKLLHAVRGSSEAGCTLVARARFAQPTLHPIPPGLIEASFTLFRHAFLRGRRTRASAAGDHMKRERSELPKAPDCSKHRYAATSTTVA